jgi:hypothetical protein
MLASTWTQVLTCAPPRDVPFASSGYGVGSVGKRRADPIAGAIYRLIRRPALAEIVGEGRPWTVLMISASAGLKITS